MNQIPDKVQKDFKAYLAILPYKIKDYKIMFVGPEKPSGAIREDMIYNSEYPILLHFKFNEMGVQQWCLVGVKV